MIDMSNKSGFTLVELIVAVFIGMMVLGGVYSMISTGLKSSSAIEKKVTALQDARAALEIMAMEIRMASYNPNYVTGIWQDPNCGVSVNQGYKGIQAASANSITIEMDIDASSFVGDSANEIIIYNYDQTNQYITRETRTCPGPTSSGQQPFMGDLPNSGNPRTVLVNNGNAIPLFTYFDKTGTQITNLPADIPNIRRIEIVLVAETADIDPNLGARRQMIYSTSIIPRNHVICQ